MIVLSLFDGCSCAQVALERIGINVDKYYASEIDKYAIQITQKNYLETIQLGSITDWRKWDIEQPDLIIGGSPCQGFSFAGKQLNFDDSRSKLFFEFVNILNYYEPKYFLLENVKMKQEYQDIISASLRFPPIEINSSLVSAQNRKRLYWCNWEIEQPKDKGILLKNIIHENETGNSKYLKISRNLNIKNNQEKSSCLTNGNKGDGNHSDMDLFEFLVPFDNSLEILKKEISEGKIGFFRKDSQANRVYSINGKAVTLCGSSEGGAAKMGQYLFGCLTPDRLNKRQNGQRFNNGEKFYTLTAQDQHGILTNGYIRRLTPIECERLQTLPDNYTEGVSNTQRYKMLGNGFTVDIIAHILKYLKNTMEYL